MRVTFAAPTQSLAAAAAVLTQSIERGDWEDDFCEEISPALTALARAGDHDPADPTDRARLEEVTLDYALADELWGILGSDTATDGDLRPVVEALDRVLDGPSTPR